MKRIKNFFRRRDDSATCDVKAVMIKAAFNGDFVCDGFVDLLKSEEAEDAHIPVIMFGLTRATASFLKALERTGIRARSQFEAMLNVWLNDVEDYDYFEKWAVELEEHRMGLR